MHYQAIGSIRGNVASCYSKRPLAALLTWDQIVATRWTQACY